MPVSVGFKGSCEKMAHRAWLIPSSEKIFRERRRLLLFLTQLEYLQKMFSLVKDIAKLLLDSPDWQPGAFQSYSPRCAGALPSCNITAETPKVVWGTGVSVLPAAPTFFSHNPPPSSAPRRVPGRHQRKVKLCCIQAFSCCALLHLSRIMRVCVLTHSLKNQ